MSYISPPLKKYVLIVTPEIFLPFFRHVIVGLGSPRTEQKKLATPPTRTPWFVGFFTISGGSVNRQNKK